MSVLWIAFGIYILGVALVLFIRPDVMFQPGGGTWKEFGLSNTGSYTVFPFWMFALAWAVLSYALATLGSVFFASLALRSTMEPSNNISMFTPVSKVEVPEVSPSVPFAKAAKAAEAVASLPGYYVLESPKIGQPKYVYYGTEPPTL
jgi:hypothetical protein